jgi:hypothetical protein
VHTARRDGVRIGDARQIVRTPRPSAGVPRASTVRSRSFAVLRGPSWNPALVESPLVGPSYS